MRETFSSLSSPSRASSPQLARMRPWHGLQPMADADFCSAPRTDRPTELPRAVPRRPSRVAVLSLPRDMTRQRRRDQTRPPLLLPTLLMTLRLNLPSTPRQHTSRQFAGGSFQVGRALLETALHRRHYPADHVFEGKGRCHRLAVRSCGRARGKGVGACDLVGSWVVAQRSLPIYP